MECYSPVSESSVESRCLSWTWASLNSLLSVKWGVCSSVWKMPKVSSLLGARTLRRWRDTKKVRNPNNARKMRPPIVPPMIAARFLLLCDACMEVGVDVDVSVGNCIDWVWLGGEDPTLKLIAEFRASIAASWPQGSGCWGLGPDQLGEYQSVPGIRAWFNSALY